MAMQSNGNLAERLDSQSVPVRTPAPGPRKLALVGPGCRFLRREREVMERLLPGADARLSALPFLLLETSVAPGVRLLKDVGLAQVAIPVAHGGRGASALETAQIHRAIASRSPSLGLAATMHTFAARTLVEYAARGAGGDRLAAIAAQGAFLASGFVEAGPGLRPLELSLRAIANRDGSFTVSGRKKPCTLARSMDYLSAGVLAVDETGKTHRAVALVPANLPGVERRSLGPTAVLAGAENDELVCKNVVVPRDHVFYADDARFDEVELRSCVWLELGLGSTYVGMASALVERALARGKALGSVERVGLWSEVELAMAALTGLAAAVDAGEGGVREWLARGVALRLGARATLDRITQRCAEVLREPLVDDEPVDKQRARDPEVDYLLGLPRALAFHPSSRTVGAQVLAAYLDGDDLELR
jgi:alkylation response protein AidB-like acyl-CoA dehydrogenase